MMPVGEGLSCRLSYSFNPGSKEDGVTVYLPLDLLNHIHPEIFEWLVPGLLHEKVSFLLKGLPKNLRKKLIPIQPTAEKVTGALKMYQGSLFGQMEELITRKFRLKISRSQWPVAHLPPHLRMRYLVHDSSGRTIITSRNFSDLKVERQPEPDNESLEELRRQWERTGLTAWDFENLPDNIPIKDSNNKLLGFVYPGLQPEQTQSVAVRLFSSPEKRMAAGREGLLLLSSLQFPKQFKMLKKECVLPSSLWALYEGLGSRQSLNEDLYQFILEELFISPYGFRPSGKEFHHMIERLKNEGLFPRVRKLLELVLNLLRERRATLDQIGRMKKMSRAKSRAMLDVAPFDAALKEIVPAGFLKKFNEERVSSAIRYCKALQIRIERAYVAPEKDRMKSEQLARHTEKLKKFQPRDPSPACMELLEEYKKMLAEYTISLFAQEIKTLFPVSAKRLEKKWQEILSSC